MKKRKAIPKYGLLQDSLVRLNRQIGDEIDNKLRDTPWGALCSGVSIGQVSYLVEKKLYKTGQDLEET